MMRPSSPDRPAPRISPEQDGQTNRPKSINVALTVATLLARALVILAVPVVLSCCVRYGTIVIGNEGSRLLGKLAPDFTLAPLEGGPPVRLSAQRGKTVMLVFWSQGGHALPLVDQAYRFFKPKGLVIWTINDEDPTSIARFMRRQLYQFPVLLDRDSQVSREYLESGNTTAVIVSPKGEVIRYKQNFFGENDFWKMLADCGFRLPLLNKRSSEGGGAHRPIRTQTNSLGMSLAYVPAGRFLMGRAAKGMPEWPVHRVEVSGLWMGQYEVTNAQFDRFQKRPRLPGDSGGRDPAVRVSWEDAVRFCEWLSRKEGRRYRLPTEAEWEYAARGGLIRKDYPWGDEPPEGRAAVGELATSPVGSYAPNGFGLYDMAGNVQEWVSDWYARDYYRHSRLKDPTGPINPSVKLKIRRGGSFAGWQCYCWVRVPSPPEVRTGDTGVRVVLAPRHGAPGKPRRIAQ